MCDDLGIVSGHVLVWHIRLNGSWIVCEHIKDVCAILEYDTEDFEPGDKAVVKRIKMTRKKFESLPEFEGY